MSTIDYLAVYDAAPESEKFALARGWLDSEPLPFFAQLRAQRPILVTPQATFIALFHDVTEVLNLPKIFTAALYLPKMGNGVYLMCHDDDALHTREKSIMQGLLNRDDLPKVRALIGKLANEVLDAAKGKLEVAYGYSRNVPAGLVQQYFGLGGIERSELIEWSYWNQYNTFHNQPFDIISDARRAEITKFHTDTGNKLTMYIAGLVARRLPVAKARQAGHTLFALWFGLCKLARKLAGRPTEEYSDDIVTRMFGTSFPDEVDFDIARMAVNAGGLLIGAIETTAQCATQSIAYLLERPELLKQAIAAAKLDDTRAFDGIVWETLRFVPLSPYLFRQAASEYTVGKNTPYQTTIAPGTNVLTLTQSAMFDPRVFEQPEEFIATRNWFQYFTFGFGSHECLGKYVGMVLIPELVRQLLLRPGIRAEGAIDRKGGPFPEVFNVRWD